jgi:hypothetical protein
MKQSGFACRVGCIGLHWRFHVIASEAKQSMLLPL